MIRPTFDDRQSATGIWTASRLGHIKRRRWRTKSSETDRRERGVHAMDLSTNESVCVCVRLLGGSIKTILWQGFWRGGDPVDLN